MSREQDSRYMMFLVKELQQRTEQLAISQEHVAKLQDQLRTATAPKTSVEKFASMSVENQLMAIDEAIGGHSAIYSQLRSQADHQLVADIKALTERVSDLEFAAKTGYFDVSGSTAGQIVAARNLNAAIDQQVIRIIDRERRIGGILSKRS